MIANCWHLLLRPRAKMVLAFLAHLVSAPKSIYMAGLDRVL